MTAERIPTITRNQTGDLAWTCPKCGVVYGSTAEERVNNTVEKHVCKVWAPKRLEVACGQHVETGWTGIDIVGKPDSAADIVQDLWRTPWPIKAGSVKEARISHFVEHIPHLLPEYGSRDVWWVFWDEMHRIMAKGGIVDVVHPYSRSDRAFWDPTHTRYIHEATWLYLDPKWREANGLQHYPTVSDFETVTIEAVGVPDALMTRSTEQQQFAAQHYWNVYPDLHVRLKKR
jgi:hypothetical protein